MTVTLRQSIERISDPRNLDASVAEVFPLILGVECRRDPEPIELEPESVTAVVGFAGLLSGACIFRAGMKVAVEIVRLMSGRELEDGDDSVKDGIGEICNVLAGTWKSNVPELAAHCGLSIPAVITGRDYGLRIQAPAFCLHHRYRFDENSFQVTILCDTLQ